MGTDFKILLLTLDVSFDVIALTETWLNETNADLFDLEGYDFVIKIFKKEKTCDF